MPTRNFYLEQRRRNAEWKAYKNKQWLKALAGIGVALAVIVVIWAMFQVM